VGRAPDYREIEHTADVGIELEAPDLRTGLERSAAAMFDMICGLDSVGVSWRRRVTVKARSGDIENLLVRWLAELLYLFESERVLLSEFSIERIDERGLEADVAGQRYDPERHAIRVEIKAPTYHDLSIRRAGDGWAIRVIFDT